MFGYTELYQEGKWGQQRTAMRQGVVSQEEDGSRVGSGSSVSYLIIHWGHGSKKAED